MYQQLWKETRSPANAPQIYTPPVPKSFDVAERTGESRRKARYTFHQRGMIGTCGKCERAILGGHKERPPIRVHIFLRSQTLQTIISPHFLTWQEFGETRCGQKEISTSRVGCAISTGNSIPECQIFSTLVRLPVSRKAGN